MKKEKVYLQCTYMYFKLIVGIGYFLNIEIKKGPEKTYKPAKQHFNFILNVFI